MATIRLTGIWDEGSPASVSTNVRREIELVQNETTEILFSLITPTGAPYNIDVSGANRLLFTLKTKPGTGAVVEKEATAEPDPGEYRFTILPNDTRDTVARRMFYDVWGVEGAVQQSTIPLSPANLIAGLAEL